MDTITVYRVEHPKTKRGPWHSPSSKAYDEMCPREQASIRTAQGAVVRKFANGKTFKTHPGAHIDCGPEGDFALGMKWVCACPSLAILCDWFASEGDALYDAGFTVMAYEMNAEDVMQSKSGTQVLILQSAAVDEKDLTILALVR